MVPRPSRLALAACLALALAQLASAAVIGNDKCICSDVRPRVGTGDTHAKRFAVGATCEQVRAAGDCDAEWVLDTVKELEGQGYCMITCGRCKCCQPVADTLRAAGLTSVLDAAKGTPYEEAFADPAWMGVVLAPKDDTPVRDLAAHILPPVAEWGNATWTADLLAAEQSVATAAGTRLPVWGAQVGRGRVVQGDIQACKAVVHVVDTAVA